MFIDDDDAHYMYLSKATFRTDTLLKKKCYCINKSSVHRALNYSLYFYSDSSFISQLFFRKEMSK